MEEHKHELIHTPPYLPGVQPIERVWAYAKNHVASRYRAGRTVRELVAQTYEGFYGDGKQHVGVDARLCASVIQHSHKLCDHLIEQDDALNGRIDDLTTEASVAQPDVEDDVEKWRWTHFQVHGRRRTGTSSGRKLVFDGAVEHEQQRSERLERGLLSPLLAAACLRA